MNIYIYQEQPNGSGAQSVTVNKSNGGMPLALSADEVRLVTREEMQAILDGKAEPTAEPIESVPTQEEVQDNATVEDEANQDKEEDLPTQPEP